MSAYEDAGTYARRIRNNTAARLEEVTLDPDGNARDLPSELAVGVLIAQSNLAIAASLVEAAAILRNWRPVQ